MFRADDRHCHNKGSAHDTDAKEPNASPCKKRHRHKGKCQNHHLTKVVLQNGNKKNSDTKKYDIRQKYPNLVF